MTEQTSSLTPTDIIASATHVLTDHDYRRVSGELDPNLSTTGIRLFEDEYGIVAVAVYDSWEELEAKWIDAHSALVDLLERHVMKTEGKAWDGYVVLITPLQLTREQLAAATDIRYDTHRTRKLVITGNDIKSISDVQNALLPILPLRIDDNLLSQSSALEVLPELMAERGIEQSAVISIIDSFTKDESILSGLHEYLHGDLR